MTEIMAPSLPIRRPDLSQARLKRRYAAERRFRLYGIFAVLIAAGMLGLLLATIVGKGYSAFYRTDIRLEVTLDPSVIDPAGTKDPDAIMQADYTKLLRESLRQLFPGVTSRTDKRDLNALVSSGADTQIRKMVQADPSLIGQTVTVSVPIGPDFDMLAKGFISRDMPESARRVSDKQIGWYDALRQQDRIEHGFNWSFFTASDSREPELAGVAGSVVGTLMTMFVTLLLAFPLAVATAVYLEEFAPKNRWTDLIEVNINNLAAVPSIVFGLLGLAIYIGFFGLPRSAPLVGGMVLALMTLPVIVIATRAALKAVPPSIREGAYGIGASPLQVVTHHVVPLAMPGILTGTIIGMARALGETAPLLMIGMVAFIVGVPKSVTDAATVLPVQIYLWADSPERGFVEKTSAAIMVLLVFLVLMNGIAVYLRRRFERRW
jgi:phosphate transport system permease protein